ncbi:MAG: hypothetical protein OEL85_00330 [Desulfobulbaceae bacterium]|nr:hypothetical protein [Desulfobulbaceae bacterium]
MKKVQKKDNSIKDSISKLFILRDSCQGTCMTQEDNPNIIWFEGATVILQQGVDTLKSAKQKLDSGDKDANKLFRSKVKETISKLMVLQRSAVVTRSDDLAENVIWFEGAEYMISDVTNQLQKALQKTETQEVTQAESDSSESDESEPEKEEEESETEEDDDDTVNKKAAA